MKTKKQKIKAVEAALENLKKSQTVIIADFTGIGANEMNYFRRTLKSIGAIFRVVKKRLLKFIFEKEGMIFDPEKFVGQTGVIFSPKDLTETAGKVYEFAKTKKDLFKFLGGFDILEKKFIEGADVKKIGQLPPRAVLLGQLVGMLSAPIRKFMFVLNEKGRSNH